MPTHSGSLPHRFALLAGLARKPKVASTPAVKAGAPALSKRPARVQAPAPQPANRFDWLRDTLNPGGDWQAKRMRSLGRDSEYEKETLQNEPN